MIELALVIVVIILVVWLASLVPLDQPIKNIFLALILIASIAVVVYYVAR